MFLAIAGLILVGVPGVVLGVWFSWLTRRCWLRGGFARVVKIWSLCLALIAGVLAVVWGALGKSEFGLPYDTLACFVVFAVAGGIPSAVIAVVVSFLTHFVESAEASEEVISLDWCNAQAVFVIVIGAVSGLVASVFSLRLSMSVMDAAGI